MRLSHNQQYYLRKMGIDVWLLRENAAGSDTDTEIPRVDSDTGMEIWEALQEEVVNCTACQLHKDRTQTVFGTGDIHADWLFIGEAPGAEEDKQGEPFVGRAGKLLNAMIRAIGLSREQVYIANIVKCRPPKNRDPGKEEVISCERYLKRQIELIHPKIIIALGRVAAQNLLKVDTPIGRMRGQLYDYDDMGIPVVVTYHPAYLLRSPREKSKSWQDLKLAMQVYRENP